MWRRGAMAEGMELKKAVCNNPGIFVMAMKTGLLYFYILLGYRTVPNIWKQL